MKFPTVTGVTLLCLTALQTALAQYDVDYSRRNRKAAMALIFENDAFGSTDQHYTNGMRLELTFGQSVTPHQMWPGLRMAFDSYSEVYQTLLVGQDLYTPSDISEPGLIKDDRPYAGWLYGGLRFAGVSSWRTSRWGLPARDYSALEISGGVIGPSAKGEEMQTQVHETIDSTIPKGWDNQLNNEIAIDVSYFRSLSIRIGNWGSMWNPYIPITFDLEPFYNVRAGTVYVQGGIGLGATLGLGHLLGTTPRRLAYSGAISSGNQAPTPWSAALFGSVEGRGVAWNTFLDGNLLSNSHSVNKNPFIYHAEVGLALRYELLSFSYIQVIRSEEFDQQENVQRYGSLRLGLEYSF